MPSLMPVVLAALAGYAIGCFATGYYLVRWRTGKDLHAIGSGATGGRNVGRILGPVGFLVTAGVDVAKSALAVAIPIWLGLGAPAVAAAMIGVSAGHVWPAQLGFRGGKGIAPFVGSMLVVAPIALAAGAIGSAVGIVVTRRFNIGGLAGMGVAPLVALALGAAPALAAGIAGALLIAIVAHRTNFQGELEAPSFERRRLVPRAGRSGG